MTETLNDKNSISVQDFFKRAGFSQAYFYKIKKAGAKLPPIQKTDKSSRILLSDAKEWDRDENEFPEIRKSGNGVTLEDIEEWEIIRNESLKITEENSITIEEFCEMHEICRTTYNKLKVYGLTPTAYKKVSNNRILLSDVEEWEKGRKS